MCRNCDNFGICQNKCVPPTEVEFSNARIPAVEIPSDSSLESELNYRSNSKPRNNKIDFDKNI